MAVDRMVDHPGYTLHRLQLHLLLPAVPGILLFVHVEVDDRPLGGRGVEDCPGREELLIGLHTGGMCWEEREERRKGWGKMKLHVHVSGSGV